MTVIPTSLLTDLSGVGDACHIGTGGAAYVLTNKPMPTEPPSLNDMVRRVAMLGGFLARKADGEPGVKTIWIGLQRVTDFAAGVRFMRQSGDSLSCV